MIDLPSSPQSICILRLSAIGDVTHVLPVIHLLKKHYADCQLNWVIGKTEYSLVKDLPDINFFILDKSLGLQGYKQLARQIKQKTKGKAFDILLNLHASMRANLASLLIKSPIKIGFDRQRARNWQWMFTNKKISYVPQQHVLDSFLQFTDLLRVAKPEKANDLCWDLPLNDEEQAFAYAYIKPQQQTLIINPCSSVRANNWRNWSIESYARVADYAIKTHNVQVILTGGPSHKEIIMGKEIEANMQYSPINLIGKTNLKQLLALLNSSDLLIAPDTGPAHMATVVGTPVIGLFASSNPLRTGPYLSQQYLVNQYPLALKKFNNKDLKDVSWGARVRHPKVMDLIKVEDVILKLDSFFSG